MDQGGADAKLPTRTLDRDDDARAQEAHGAPLLPAPELPVARADQRAKSLYELAHRRAKVSRC
jgi:hypothetical protein